MAVRRKSVGLITLSLARERTDLAAAFGNNAFQALQSAGLEVRGNKELVFETGQCIAAARGLQEQGVDCLLLLLGTWVFAPTVVDTLRAVDVPFGIWAEDNPGSFSLTAGGMVHGSLDELGLKHRFFYGSPRSARLLEEMAAFVSACACARDLDGQRLAVVGGRVPGMYTTMADIIQVKNLFGVETEHIDAVRVHLLAESLAEKEVAGVSKELLAEIRPDPHGGARAGKIHPALHRFESHTGEGRIPACGDQMHGGDDQQLRLLLPGQLPAEQRGVHGFL